MKGVDVMMKFKKATGIVLSIAVLLSSAVTGFAAGEQISEAKVNIRGNLGQETEYVIQVLAPGKTVSDLDKTGNNAATNYKALVYQNQNKTAANGDYFETFNIDYTDTENRPGGYYTIRMYSVKNGALLADDTFLFVNNEAFKNAIGNLNQTAKTGGDVAKSLSGNAEELGFSAEGISASNSAIAAVLASDIVNCGDLNPDDMEGSKKRYKLAAVIAALNEGKLGNVFDYIELITAEEYADSYTDELLGFMQTESENESDKLLLDGGIQSSATKSMYNKSMRDTRDINKELYKAATLAVIENPDGVDNAKAVINAFAAVTGADIAGVSDDKLNAVCGTLYSSIGAFNTAVKSGSGDGEGGNGGSAGTGGGGGGGGSASGNVTKPLVTTNPQVSQSEGQQELLFDVYSDLEDAIWARNAIVNLTNKGILAGRSLDKFEPNASVTREEFVKMLVAAFITGETESGAVVFADVDKNEWYYPYIIKGVGQGIVTGYSESIFGIGDNITRQDMAVMAYRAVMSEYKPEDLASTFIDENEISDYAKDAVLVMSQKGIINGKGNKSFCPNDTATRAEAAKIIYEIIELLY